MGGKGVQLRTSSLLFCFLLVSTAAGLLKELIELDDEDGGLGDTDLC